MCVVVYAFFALSLPLSLSLSHFDGGISVLQTGLTNC